MAQTNRRPDTASVNKNIDQDQVRQNASRNYWTGSHPTGFPGRQGVERNVQLSLRNNH